MNNLKEMYSEMKNLETDAAILRLDLNKKFDGETYRELKAKTDKLDDLNRRYKIESEMKEKYREKYSKSFASEADFERLWNSELRDRAMAESADDKTDLSEVMRHSIYSKF